jgi:hypothetical protein
LTPRATARYTGLPRCWISSLTGCLHARQPRYALLLDAGADPTIRDSKHDADAIGWAEFFRQTDSARLNSHREGVQ